MDAERLQSILASFPQRAILVAGDFFLDKYLLIEQGLAELSLETGLNAHQVVEVRCQPGAAGTVTSNLRSMDVQVIALGVIGDDGEGFELVRGLYDTGVDTDSLIVRADRFTPTYTKPMLRAPDGSERELERLDIKNRAPLPADVEDQLIRALRDLLPHVDGVILADQVQEEDCGVLTGRVREAVCKLAGAHPRVIVAADSRARIGLFHNVTLKPNQREATLAIHPNAGEPHSNLQPAARNLEPRKLAETCALELHRRSGRPVFLTLGAEGILAFHAGGPTSVPAPRITGPVDPVGAGDSTMAGITAALCSGATIAEAAEVGCLAAAVTIQQIGTTGTASRPQILDCWRQTQRATYQRD